MYFLLLQKTYSEAAKFWTRSKLFSSPTSASRKPPASFALTMAQHDFNDPTEPAQSSEDSPATLDGREHAQNILLAAVSPLLALAQHPYGFSGLLSLFWRRWEASRELTGTP